MTGLGIQSFVAVIVVLGLVAALAWLLRRGAFGALRGGSRSIAVETAVPLGERRTLVIVSVEGRRLLLGLTPAAISLVAELGASAPAPETPAAPGGATPSFEQLLVSRAKEMFRRTPPSASALRGRGDETGQSNPSFAEVLSPAGDILKLNVGRVPPRGASGGPAVVYAGGLDVSAAELNA